VHVWMYAHSQGEKESVRQGSEGRDEDFVATRRSGVSRRLWAWIRMGTSKVGESMT
jgi:hypothetical protein